MDMMVGRVLANVFCKLCHLNLCLEILLEACKQNLALTQFEAVKQMGDLADVLVLGEEDQLLDYEVQVFNTVLLRLPVV